VSALRSLLFWCRQGQNETSGSGPRPKLLTTLGISVRWG
jgi:hypothetical protein